MEFARSLWLFLIGIGRHWYVLLPGVAGGGVDVFERIAGKALILSSAVAWSILALSVLVAAAWSYHDLRMEHLRLRGRADEVEIQLGLFLERGRALHGRTEPQTEADLRSWENESNAWVEEVVSWIAEHLGIAEREVFLDRSEARTLYVSGDPLSRDREQIRANLSKHVANLRSIMRGL